MHPLYTYSPHRRFKERYFFTRPSMPSSFPGGSEARSTRCGSVGIEGMTTSNPTSDSNAMGIDLMRTEISMGLAFAKLASGAGDQIRKRDRNRANAQKPTTPS